MAWWLPLAFSVAPVPPPPSQVAIDLTAETWPELGLGYATFKGLPSTRTPWPRGGVVQQGILRGTDERASWLIRIAPDESLATFRDEHRDWTVVATTATVCGRRVPAFTATRAAQHITCVITATGNHPAYDPPERVMAVQVAHHGMQLVATFDVESEHLDAWRYVEASLFASLRCDPR